MRNIISENLRQLRMAKNLTQAQVANALSVSTHAVSRWECGTTFPDVMLLPQIAKLYCVTVSELYRRDPLPSDNYARLLCNQFIASQSPNDFLNALHEFEKLRRSGQTTDEDMYCYGLMHQTMIKYCVNELNKTVCDIINCANMEQEENLVRAKRQLQCLIDDIWRCYEQIDRVSTRNNGTQDIYPNT